MGAAADRFSWDTGHFQRMFLLLPQTILAHQAKLPKKKHPHLLSIIRLLTAPFSFAPSTITAPLVPLLVQQLLTFPSLPSVLPLPALTHLTTHLPLFSLILPTAASQPDILSGGALSQELAKTSFLANLATFGIAGGMLQRYGISGASTWITVVGTVIGLVEDGWGRWVEGMMDFEDEDVPMQQGSDDEGDEKGTFPPKKTRSDVRLPLAANYRPKLVSFASPSHLDTLSNILTSPTSKASTALLTKFSSFVLGLLRAFRGTPRWEGILDALMEGQKGSALTRRLWREGVRGKWRNTGARAEWDTFSESVSALIFQTRVNVSFQTLRHLAYFFSLIYTATTFS